MEKLKIYEVDFKEFYEDDNGEWCQLEDVKHIEQQNKQMLDMLIKCFIDYTNDTNYFTAPDLDEMKNIIEDNYQKPISEVLND